MNHLSISTKGAEEEASAKHQKVQPLPSTGLQLCISLYIYISINTIICSYKSKLKDLIMQAHNILSAYREAANLDVYWNAWSLALR